MARQEIKPLRRGWTTGACAAAAARAAFSALVSGRFPDPVSIRLPRGATASFPLALAELSEARARAGIVKDVGDDKRAVGDVGVVTGILDDAGAGAALAQFGKGQREARSRTARQADRHRIGEPTGHQRAKGRARGGSGTGAGRPAAPQRFDLLPCHAPILAKPAAMPTLWPLAVRRLVPPWSPT